MSDEQAGDKEVFLAGATSLVGERITRALLRAGYGVIALSHRPESRRFLVQDPRVRAVQGDLAAEPSGELREALERATGGIVCAAHIRHAAPLAALGRAIGDGGRPFVALSSARLHTRFASDGTRDAVASGESALQGAAERSVILRPTMIFGGQRDANLGRLIDWLDRRRWLPLIDSGRALIQPVHADDVAGAVVESLRRAPRLHEAQGPHLALDLGGGEKLSLREAADRIAEELGHRRVRVVHIPVSGIYVIAPLAVMAGRAWVPALDSLRRQTENRDVDNRDAERLIDYHPMDFTEALRRKLLERRTGRPAAPSGD